MSLFFFFNDTATTEIYPLSLHDALPICAPDRLSGLGLRPPAELGADALVAVRILTRHEGHRGARQSAGGEQAEREAGDRKSTRLNSSHSQISYAVFCLKKKMMFSISTTI